VAVTFFGWLAKYWAEYTLLPVSWTSSTIISSLRKSFCLEMAKASMDQIYRGARPSVGKKYFVVHRNGTGVHRLSTLAA
jgi:hypothetical protein